MASLFLGACPACFENFKKLLCHLPCSPRQSEFARVTGKKTLDNGKEKLLALEYMVSREFATGMYDSCKEVNRFGIKVRRQFARALYHASRRSLSVDGCRRRRFLSTYHGGDGRNDNGLAPCALIAQVIGRPCLAQLSLDAELLRARQPVDRWCREVAGTARVLLLLLLLHASAVGVCREYVFGSAR